MSRTVGLTRLETVRVSRAAADQRRGRAGRIEPGVCYRLWDEPQTAALAALCAAGNPCRRSLLAGARPRAMGRRRSGQAGVSRSAAGSGAQRSARAARRSRRHRRARAASRPRARRSTGCRCRRGLPAWWSTPAARAPGGIAAEIAAVLTERGLGGNDVDLRHRLDALRRDRSGARGGSAPHGEAMGRDGGRLLPPPGGGGRLRSGRRSCAARPPPTSTWRGEALPRPS